VAMAGELAELREENEVLAGKLARLEYLLSRNSTNSSCPPSKDDGPGKSPPPVDTRRGGGPERSKGKHQRTS
jgi:transposase